MPEPLHDRIELSIAAIDELMVLLGKVDAVDPLVQPSLRPSEGDADDGEGTQSPLSFNAGKSEMALDTSG